MYGLNDYCTLTRHAVNMVRSAVPAVGRFGHASFVFPDFSSRNDSPTADAMPGARNKLAGVLFRQNMHHKRLEALPYAVRSYFRGEVASSTNVPRGGMTFPTFPRVPVSRPTETWSAALLSRRRSPPLWKRRSKRNTYCPTTTYRTLELCLEHIAGRYVQVNISNIENFPSSLYIHI